MHELMIPVVIGGLTAAVGVLFEFRARTRLDAEQRETLRASSREMNKPLLIMAAFVILLSLFKNKFGPLNKVTALSGMGVIALIGGTFLVRAEKKLSSLSLSNSYFQLHRRSLVALCSGAGIVFVAGCAHLITR